MPTVACIIPVKNGERFLLQAIRSATDDELVHEIVIVVDSASTDRSREIAEGFDNRRVVVARQMPKRPGVSHARNLGVRMSASDYVAFLDADDEWLPGKTEAQLRALEGAIAGLSLASCDVDQFLEPGTTMPETIRKDRMGPVNFLVPSTLMCHRAVFDLVGGFEPDRALAEDVDWYNRAFRLGVSRVHVPKVLVRKRVHGASASQRNIPTYDDVEAMQREIGMVLGRVVVPRMFPVI